MRHPDEGEIHAWLDGALAPDEAARIEAHVASCARCAEEVATARGLIAGASRILLALDSVPGGVIPARPATADMAAPAAGPDDGTGPVPSSRTTKPTVRRHISWFSRPLTRIAAGLVLAAGIGTVAVRRDQDAPNRLTVELRTESVAESAGQASPAPSVGDAFGGVASTPPPSLDPAPDRDGNEITRAAVRVQPQSRLPAATTGTGTDQAARGAA